MKKLKFSLICLYIAVFGASLIVGACRKSSESVDNPGIVDSNQNRLNTTNGTNNPNNPNNPVKDPNSPTTGNSNRPIEDTKGLQRFLLTGRFNVSEGNIVFGFPNSKISFKVINTSKISLSLQDSGYDRLRIDIDGKYETIIVTKPGNEALVYEIKKDLSLGEHTVELTKITEFSQNSQVSGDREYVGTSALKDVILDTNGRFLRPPIQKQVIVFTGDSAYTGYGVLDSKSAGSSDVCSLYSPATQDSVQSVPFYTAAALNMDMHNISASGKAIFRSRFNPDPNTTIPAIYKQVLPFNVNPVWDTKAGQNFSVVVIGAGPNDIDGQYGAGYLPDPAGFLNSYVNLIKFIRQASPNALIIATISPGAGGSDRQNLLNYIGQAVEQVKSGGDNRVLLYDVWADKSYKSYLDAAQPLGLDFGCQYHYGPKGAQYIGNELAGFIKKNL